MECSSTMLVARALPRTQVSQWAVDELLCAAGHKTTDESENYHQSRLGGIAWVLEEKWCGLLHELARYDKQMLKRVAES
jgi:hypothetical protein